ncbi:MAG: hypothetical protein E6R07_10730 [Nevskiaceae bacterium]|nr:MAG: hypothetical protein E6R07_10730 [Nevskiaceae bacterium]
MQRDQAVAVEGTRKISIRRPGCDNDGPDYPEAHRGQGLDSRYLFVVGYFLAVAAVFVFFEDSATPAPESASAAHAAASCSAVNDANFLACYAQGFSSMAPQETGAR